MFYVVLFWVVLVCSVCIKLWFVLLRVVIRLFDGVLRVLMNLLVGVFSILMRDLCSLLRDGILESIVILFGLRIDVLRSLLSIIKLLLFFV